MTEEEKKQRSAFKALVKSETVTRQMIAALDRADPARVQRIVGLMLNAAVKAPDLYRATQESVLKVMMDCVAYGIEPNGRDAYVIPYAQKGGGFIAQLIISYMGMITLCHKSERIAKVEAVVVRRGDSFTWHNGEYHHSIDWFGADRGDIVGTYAVATYKDGTRQAEILTIAEIEAVRMRSKSPAKGPWATDFEEMAKKTAVRRLSKYLPLSPDAAAAIAAEEDYVDVEAVTEVQAKRKRATASAILAAVEAPVAELPPPAPQPVEMPMTAAPEAAAVQIDFLD